MQAEAFYGLLGPNQHPISDPLMRGIRIFAPAPAPWMAKTRREMTAGSTLKPFS